MEIFRSITNQPVGELMEYIHRTYTYSTDINEIFEDLPDYCANFYNLVRKFVKIQPLGDVECIRMTRINNTYNNGHSVVINIAYISNNGTKKNTKTTIPVYDSMTTHDDDKLPYLQLGINTLVKFRSKYNI
tara:strand:+ start:612 stop:1004 length:393 start_codon:yes stop_codon:yes gene_type:complete